jgi:ABC-type microcin C transport system duplicated ATPase subunit YejF
MEAIQLHQGLSRYEAKRDRAVEMLELVGIPRRRGGP